ncbi:zinc-binding dehydrogenase [Nocardioides sp. R-C-SC26]|uniref:zinc-binding dehydrogenase n=1 Tax=Nocardioides sp. R-C-SC26 TaxID=2870414 RepID=UPI001E44A9BB|nr:zinc-binding dehydrogenase [Nocardioides sp. R-C-SC26]
MKAAVVERAAPKDPLSALAVRDDVEVPTPPDADWVEVRLRAAALNLHDVWLLRGAGLREDLLPLVLGSDGAGVAEGRDVLLHAVLPDAPGTLAPGATLLCDGGYGTLAQRTAVPRTHLVAKPAHLDWAQAACLPTSWLTAWRMLTTQAGVRAGHRVLVQGAGGGVATAAVQLAAAMGCEVTVAARDVERAERTRPLGAAHVVAAGDRLPALVDVVIESVGAATWEHSLRALRPGGTVVVCGAATGFHAETDLARVFARQLRILGSSMGTLAELHDLVAFVEQHALEPAIDVVATLDGVPEQFERLVAGRPFGKIAVDLT